MREAYGNSRNTKALVMCRKASTMTHKNIATASFPAKGAIVACFSLALSACGGTGDLWQGEEVLVEARQVNLERSVVGVSEDNRELKDRFNALERLYVDLVRHVRSQDQTLESMEKKLANFQKDPETETAIRRMRNEMSGMRKDVKALENRLFSVEMTERNVNYPSNSQPAQQQPASQQQQQQQPSSTPAQQPDSAPTGTSTTGADVQTGDLGTPVAPQPQQQNNRTYYGAHLASYRSKDQVSSGWSAIYRAFTSELEGLKPLVYVQSQQGIGTFLRLIVGPMDRPEDAELLCENIRSVGGEQYCRVSEYQGEPIE